MNDTSIKRSAKRMGITPEEYKEHLDAGEKWCSAHGAWHPRSEFGIDRHRFDGLFPSCRASMKRPNPKTPPPPSYKGRKHSEETRQRMSDAKKGSMNSRWKGGVTPPIRRARQTREYYIWRKQVFERDRYTCQKCGKVGGDLQAHHIKPFCADLDGRLNVDNGMTLCEPCHRAEHYG